MESDLVIKVSFGIGEFVEFVNKSGKDYGCITGLSIRGLDNHVSYGVTWSDKKESYHYDFELKLHHVAK